MQMQSGAEMGLSGLFGLPGLSGLQNRI